jgi:hypothetical protein
MQFLGTIDFGKCGPIFAYPQPQPPPPSLAGKFAAEATENARREHDRRAQNERLRAMTQEERRAYVEEQRAKLAEIKQLREMTPEQRREYVERRVARKNSTVRDDGVIVSEPIWTPPRPKTKRNSPPDDALAAPLDVERECYATRKDVGYALGYVQRECELAVGSLHQRIAHLEGRIEMLLGLLGGGENNAFWASDDAA